MVSTRAKTQTKANPIVVGRIGRYLDSRRAKRRAALRAIATHVRKQGSRRARTRATALPALKAVTIDDSKWATPPEYQIEESPPNCFTTRCRHPRGIKPTCLVFTKHGKILYPDFFSVTVVTSMSWKLV